MNRYSFNDKEHIHTLDGKPLIGTTSCINEIYPPPLAWYGSAKAVELMGYVTAKKEPDEVKRRSIAEEGLAKLDELLSSDMRLDEYIAFLEKCYKNHDAYKKSRGKAGKDMHALIETYIKKCLENGGKPLPTVDSDKEITAFADWATSNVDHFIWSEGYCFSEKLWAGGISDYGVVMKNGMTLIGDAKPAVYPKQFIQTAAYSIQIKENGVLDAEGNLIVTVPKIDGFMIWDYTKGEPHYLVGENWVTAKEADFIHTIKMYKEKDLVGTTTL